MSKNSPLNFGMGNSMSNMYSGAYGNMSDQDLRSQYDNYSSMNPMMGQMFQGQRAAMQAEIQRRQTLGNFGMPQQAADTMGQAPVAGSASYQDPNNSSAVGFNNAPSEMDMPAANNFGTVPVTTGDLTPQTQNIARGMFGTASNRQRSVNRKPLINL